VVGQVVSALLDSEQLEVQTPSIQTEADDGHTIFSVPQIHLLSASPFHKITIF